MAQDLAPKNGALRALRMMMAALLVAGVLAPIAAAAEEYNPKPYVPCPGSDGHSYSGWIYVGHGAGGSIWMCPNSGPDVEPGADLHCYASSWTCWFVWHDDDTVLLAGRTATQHYQAAGAPHPDSVI